MSQISIPATGRSIVLVDDEPLVRVGTALLLEELDHHVTQASSALEALELLRDNPGIELLITDFRMPDVDGLQLITQAKEMRPAIKTLLMTGYDADDKRFDGLDIPRLAKPFGIDALEHVLSQID